MTAILETSASSAQRHREAPAITPIPARRPYSTQSQEARRRQEALERLAARGMAPPRVQPGHRRGLGPSSQPRPPVQQSPQPITPVSVPRHPSVSLTVREVEVLRMWLLVDSKSHAAAELRISVGTVNTHLARIRTKYADARRAARTKAALVARAIQDGLVTIEEL